MSLLKKYLDRARPHFQPGGRFQALQSVFDGVDTFLYTPRDTSRSGVHIHDALDSKRVMIIVVVALLPCLLFGMYNCGYQNYLGSGHADFPFWELMAYGFLAILPKIVVTYLVGLGIEFVVAQWRHEEIQEGFLVTGILIPLICPIETPLWMMAVATAFSVIFVKEVFGGTGYNIFNVALVTRAFLFFSYPASMSGDRAFISASPICGLGGTVNFADGISGATPLGQVATHAGGPLEIHNIVGDPVSNWDAF
ncbi:MAG: RnfABCDGE type electron transport complex subunit D, partial [Paramuribaculum sp.]|nr:RnfABCDGE type electron transport complex subunit D [Paramuribaculum sp.]